MKHDRNNPIAFEPASAPGPPGTKEESPGLPWFRSWRAVYWFVVGCFIFYVVFLALFSRAFS